MQAETSVTQRSPCLMNPLPDCSNYSPFFHTHYYLILWINTSLVSRVRSFTKPLCWRLILHCCSAQELMSSEEYRSALRKLNNKQRQVVMFLLLLFKLSSQSLSFFSLSLPLSAPFLNPLFSPIPHFPWPLFHPFLFF